MSKKEPKPFKPIGELPDPLPCPCCGKTDLWLGPMDSDSQGVHCMFLGDDEVSTIMMIHRTKPDVQQEILNSPMVRGCGMRMKRNYPPEIPEDLLGHPWDIIRPEYEKRTLAKAILAWNERT